MTEITLQLTIEETNLVLEALGNLPFSQVYLLVGKIQEQASQQIQTANVQKPVETPQPKDQAHD